MDVDAYLVKHGVTPMLNGIVNDLVREQPDDPISFLINGLLSEAAKAGQEPVLLQRLVELKKTLLGEQAEAVAALAERVTLAAEVDKLSYRIKHLLKTMDAMEAGAGGATASKQPVVAAAAASGLDAPVALTGVPLGHTNFSWAGGVQVAEGGGSSADASGAEDVLAKERFSQRVSVLKVFKAGKSGVGREVSISGWTRTMRMQKDLAFIAINDGSCMASLQLVVDRATIGEGWDQLKSLGGTGCAISATGELVASPGGQQEVELKVASLCVVGATTENYPLAKKQHTLEHLRTMTHLRPRTNTFGAVFRVRNALAAATHAFFQSNGFLYVNSPLITGSDCEGAGEMFRVTTLDVEKPPRGLDGKVNFAEDFFGQPSFLTVSGQLNAEHFATAFGSVYTFGPTFRAEQSNTTRHLAEFWMIEPEIAFADLNDDMNCAEAFLQHCLKHVLEHCKDDLAFLQQHYDKELIATLEGVANSPFERITYTKAVALCAKVPGPRTGVAWEYPPEWGKELQTEHERYLAETVFKKPVIVFNYPKQCKAFYMRVNEGTTKEDGPETVAAMDVLFPRLGEMVGGSQREERLDVLLARMAELGLGPEGYESYLDLRRYGTQKHSGFGVGFERLVTYATGMANIRDVIPFPRAVGQMHN